MPEPRRTRALALIALALVYFIAGKLGLKLAFVHQSATAVWPPTGIALAALLVFGRQLWPSIFVGAFFVNATTTGEIWSSLGIAAGNTLEAVAGAYLVNRFARGPDAFIRPQDVFKFAFLAGLCSTAISATLGVISLCVTGSAPWHSFEAILLTWWLGDAVGAFVVAPVLVLWARGPRPRMDRTDVLHAILLAACLWGLGMFVFSGWISWRTSYPLEFLGIPALLWAAFRFGPAIAATASAFLAAFALWGTLQGFGPFVTGSPNESLLLLQTYMGVSTVMVLMVAAVVWERDRVRQQLLSQAHELSRSNADLQQFAYVASHDLQEPLRTIACFVELLAKKHGGTGDAESDEYVGYITSGVRRMAQLIDGLLLYSRVANAASADKQADSGRALEAALANLSRAVEESQATVTRESLPPVRGDEAQLTLVFQNLVSNAIKYRGDDPPRIHVSARERGGAWVFTVSDNGPGIAAEYREQIFMLFKRLHGPEVSGAGIGLAICKRIVERHGGHIWVDVHPGPGARFCFTVPS